MKCQTTAGEKHGLQCSRSRFMSGFSSLHGRDKMNTTDSELTDTEAGYMGVLYTDLFTSMCLRFSVVKS